MKIQRIVQSFMVLSLVLLMVACTGGGGQQAQTGGPHQDALRPGGPVNVGWPLTQERQTFTIFAANGGSIVEDLMTSSFARWYTEQTNVEVIWDTVTTGAGSIIQVRIASGDLPDAINGNLSDTQIQTYALLDKVFVPLTNSIFNYAPNVVNMLNNYPIARQFSYLPDGEIYSLLRVVDTFNERVTKRAWVYQPWLDLLGIGLPQTTEEFYRMLIRFRDEIPGLIGVPEVVPFAGALNGNPANNEPESYILNSFVYYDNSTFLEILDNGRLHFVANTEEYREGLRFLNRLYREGLLAPETWTMDRSGLLRLTEGGSQNIVGAVSAMYWGHFTTEAGPIGRDLEFVSIPPLQGPRGVRHAMDRGQLVNNGRLVVTTAARNVDLIVQWADWFFDAHGQMNAGMTMNYGPENVGWTRAQPGQLNRHGQQAQYRLLRPADSRNTDNWFMFPPYYESAQFIDSFVDDFMYRKEAFGGRETAVNYMPFSALNRRVPFMYFPFEQMDEATRLIDLLRNTATGEINVWRNRFITGEASLDSDWDAYLTSLNRLGLPRYIEMYQAMYDEFVRTQGPIHGVPVRW